QRGSAAQKMDCELRLDACRRRDARRCRTDCLETWIGTEMQMNRIGGFKSKVAALILAIVLAAQPAWATILSIPFFSQLDPRWWSPTTCATVSMAMALSYRGANVDPHKLFVWLQQNHGYVNDVVSPVNWEVATHYQGTHWLQYQGVGTLG